MPSAGSSLEANDGAWLSDLKGHRHRHRHRHRLSLSLSLSLSLCASAAPAAVRAQPASVGVSV